MMTACASRIQPSQGRAPIDASMTAPCPELKPLASGTGKAVLNKLVEVSKAYYDCRSRHRRLADAVEPAAQ